MWIHRAFSRIPHAKVFLSLSLSLGNSENEEMRTAGRSVDCASDELR